MNPKQFPNSHAFLSYWQPNPALHSDPACIAFRSLSASRFLGFVHRLGAGGAGELHSLGLMRNKDEFSDLGDRPLKAFMKKIIHQDLLGLVFGAVVVLISLVTLVILIKFFPNLSQFWFGSILVGAISIGSLLGFLLLKSIE